MDLTEGSAFHKRNHTVLICEDEVDLLNLYSAMLSQDYKIVKACSGEECINKFLEIRGTLEEAIVVLLDFKLGDKKGDQLARQIKQSGKAKVILISAFEIERDQIQRLKEDLLIEEFLTKPFSLKILKETIAKCLLTIT